MRRVAPISLTEPFSLQEELLQLMSHFWTTREHPNAYKNLRFRAQLALCSATAMRGIGMRKVRVVARCTASGGGAHGLYSSSPCAAVLRYL